MQLAWLPDSNRGRPSSPCSPRGSLNLTGVLRARKPGGQPALCSEVVLKVPDAGAARQAGWPPWTLRISGPAASPLLLQLIATRGRLGLGEEGGSSLWFHPHAGPEGGG